MREFQPNLYGIQNNIIMTTYLYNTFVVYVKHIPCHNQLLFIIFKHCQIIL